MVTRFNTVKKILDQGIEGAAQIGGHGTFWRGKTRDEFVETTVFDFHPLLVIGDSASSNLIKALKGDGFTRMPSGYPPIPDEQIEFISDWIDDGCPEELSDVLVIDWSSDAELLADYELANDYWRELDNWAAFNRQSDINSAIPIAFGTVARNWGQLVRGSITESEFCLLYTSPSPRDGLLSRMPSSA